jgi:hypothetical protein
MDRKKLNNQGTLYEIVLLNVSFQYSIANFDGKVLSLQKKLPRFTEIKFKLHTVFHSMRYTSPF